MGNYTQEAWARLAREQAKAELASWKRWNARRDDLVARALTEGVPALEVSQLSGLAMHDVYLVVIMLHRLAGTAPPNYAELLGTDDGWPQKSDWRK